MNANSSKFINALLRETQQFIFRPSVDMSYENTMTVTVSGQGPAPIDYMELIVGKKYSDDPKWMLIMETTFDGDFVTVYVTPEDEFFKMTKKVVVYGLTGAPDVKVEEKILVGPGDVLDLLYMVKDTVCELLPQ